MMTPDALNEAFDSWLTGCQKIIGDHYANHYPNLAVPELTVDRNPRYWRVVTTGGSSRSVYAFIDPQNGDVLKSASWKTPAKHARGNLFDDSNGLARMGVYGPAYLR